MHLLIAAAGSGSRMRADRNKLLLPLAGRTVLGWTLHFISQAKSIEWIGIVGQSLDKPLIIPLMDECSKEVCWIEGGKTRQESVQKGLAALPANAMHVLIHDGARCLISPDLIDRCSEAVSLGQSVVAATPVTDTIKRVDDQGFICDTPKRSELWAAQTPQGFPVAELKNAHLKALSQSWEVTDDASLFERLNWSVRILEAGPSNLKVTTPFDLLIAEALLSNRQQD